MSNEKLQSKILYSRWVALGALLGCGVLLGLLLTLQKLKGIKGGLTLTDPTYST